MIRRETTGYKASRVAILPLLFAVAIGGCTSAADGRRGNSHYEAEEYTEAVTAYRDGLAAIEEDDESPLRSRYFNNAGSALHRQGEYQSAQESFVQAAATTSDNLERSQAAYNAGNNAFRMEDNKLSTDFYLQALVSNPASVSAKMNYEFVKRKLQDEEKENGDEQEKPPDPSEYAKQLKAQAEALVAQRRYRDAFRLMDDGRQVDPTVEAFASFIERVASVADIDDLPVQL